MSVEDDCPICLHPLRTEGERCNCLPCGHSFHDGCIVRMRLKNGPSRCPLCRLQCPELEGPEEMYNNALMLNTQYMYGESFEKLCELVDLVPDGYPDGYGTLAMRVMLRMMSPEGAVVGEQDIERAFKLIARAHDKGSIGATVHLGLMFHHGLGCERSIEKALNLLTQVHDKDMADVFIKLYLALTYTKGSVCERDLGKAFNLFTQCHDKGNIFATMMLAYMNWGGEACEQNFERAFELANEAYDKWDNNSTRCLRTLDRYELGCERYVGMAFNLASQAHDNSRTCVTAYYPDRYQNGHFQSAFDMYAQKQKQMIEEKLFPMVAKYEPELAGKLIGMMLEMDNSELLILLESEQQLKGKLDEAMRVLADAKEDGRAPPPVDLGFLSDEDEDGRAPALVELGFLTDEHESCLDWRPSVAEQLWSRSLYPSEDKTKVYQALRIALQRHSDRHGASSANLEEMFFDCLSAMFSEARDVQARRIGGQNQWEVTVEGGPPMYCSVDGLEANW